jgi:hypothetical protein
MPISMSTPAQSPFQTGKRARSKLLAREKGLKAETQKSGDTEDAGILVQPPTGVVPGLYAKIQELQACYVGDSAKTDDGVPSSCCRDVRRPSTCRKQ